MCCLQVVAVEVSDPTSKSVSIATRGKRAFRFSEVRDFEHLVSKLRSQCGTTLSPQHVMTAEVKKADAQRAFKTPVLLVTFSWLSCHAVSPALLGSGFFTRISWLS